MQAVAVPVNLTNESKDRRHRVYHSKIMMPICLSEQVRPFEVQYEVLFDFLKFIYQTRLYLKGSMSL